ncbi:MAG: response regulator transcription factor [Acidobacteria bacterium]|nr:response regulator transcription factor [Acidobacteriota bacterium]MBI3280333.1 response regulator transcription factor [Acidobacteriota bacterium]
MPRVVLADDHTLVAEGLARVLQDCFTLIGRFTSGRDLLRAVAADPPDVAVVDISMPDLSGIEAARELQRSSPAVKIVMLTMHTERAYVREAFRAGASAYVLKRAAPEDLVHAIHEALRGKRYLSPGVGMTLNEVLHPGTQRGELTARQLEVLQLLSEGHSAKEMASLLNISAKTVEFHRANIMKALGLRSTAELVRYAVQHGIVPP